MSRTRNWGKCEFKVREGLAYVIKIHEMGIHAYRTANWKYTIENQYDQEPIEATPRERVTPYSYNRTAKSKHGGLFIFSIYL